MQKLEPLMAESLHAEFVQIRKECIAQGADAAHVFVPVGGPLIGVPFRIMFIGRATRGWCEPNLESRIGSAEAAACVARTYSRGRKTPFWQYIDDVIRGVLRGIEADDSQPQIEQFMAWSNLAKIGLGGGGNPPTNLLKPQAEACQVSIVQEIAAYRPTAIVLPVRNYAEKEILYPVFGQDSWSWDNQERDRVAFKKSPKFESTVIWTNHPQSMGPAGYRKLATKMTIELITRTLRNELLS